MAPTDSNDGKGWIARSVGSGALRAIAYHVTLLYLIPIGIPLAAAYAGYVANLPWMYIIVAASLCFGGISTGLVRLSEWIEKGRVDGKLQFASINLGVDVHGNGYFIGVNLVSKAAVPIDVAFEEIRSRIENIVPMQTQFAIKEFTIPPEGTGFMNDHLIVVASPTPPAKLHGLAEFKIKYGKRGNLKYKLSIKKAVTLAFDAQGGLHGNWNDSL
jgi:hypothetical protein